MMSQRLTNPPLIHFWEVLVKMFVLTFASQPPFFIDKMVLGPLDG